MATRMRCSYRLKDEPNQRWSDNLFGYNFDNKRFAEIVVGDDPDHKINRIIPWENLSVMDIVKEEIDDSTVPAVFSETAGPDVVEDPE